MANLKGFIGPFPASVSVEPSQSVRNTVQIGHQQFISHPTHSPAADYEAWVDMAVDLEGLENTEFWKDYRENGLIGTALYFGPHHAAMPDGPVRLSRQS